ncbi:MAG: peptidylprolyl isomerase [Betaproteobacteria bacterium]|nr:peptidylprolyl isomerase [Betaproteobacteria bacterium]
MKLKHTLISLSLVGGLLALTIVYADQSKQATSSTNNSGKEVIVNGTAISNEKVDVIMRSQEAQGRPAGAQLERAVKDNLIALLLISQEAEKEGLDKDPQVLAQIDLNKQEILANTFQNRFVKEHPIADSVLKAEYDKMKTQAGSKEYSAEHILVKTEAEAKQIIADLKKGANFEKLAKEKSLDTGSGANGGKLGWAIPSTYVKSFADALVNLKKGQYTETPVQTQFGYHVIRLLDVRPLKAPAFDEVKERLRQNKEQEAFIKYVQDLRAKAKIENY